MKFEKKERAGAAIPMASLPDIVFLLLIFFMVSTVFKEYRGLPILVPAAKSTEKVEAKRNIAYIWADKNNRISIDDKIVPLNVISQLIGEKLAANRRLIISMKIDKEVKMGLVSDIQEQLRDAYALRVNYSTRFK
jgi:biopolymer transport protein ExbD